MRKFSCHTFIRLYFTLLIFAIGSVAFVPTVNAQEVQEPPAQAEVAVQNVKTSNGVNIIPASPSDVLLQDPQFSSDSKKGRILYLTPDRSEILRLDAEASSVIVGNPMHLSVLAENSKMLVLIPRKVGATYFTVLDKQANILAQHHVIVGAAKDKYVRIRKSCANSGDDNCQETQVFYCPGACHEIALDNGEQAVNPADADAMAAGANNMGGGQMAPPMSE